jgi:hypothetical protein
MEQCARNRGGERGPLRDRRDVVLLVVHHEHRDPHTRRRGGDRDGRRGTAELPREARAQLLECAGLEAQHHRERFEDVIHVGGHAEEADLLRMMRGDFGEHGEDRATAERMADHRVNRRMRAQDFGEAVAKPDEIRDAARRGAMSRRVDTDHGEPGGAQRFDEISEARGVTAPAVQKHDEWAAIVPVPGSEGILADAQRGFHGPGHDRRVGGVDPAAWRRAEHPERESRGQRWAHELGAREELPQAALHIGRDAGNDAAEDGFAPLFHHALAT